MSELVNSEWCKVHGAVYHDYSSSNMLLLTSFFLSQRVHTKIFATTSRAVILVQKIISSEWML